MSDAQTITCSKYGRSLPALEKPPFGGALGKEIQEKVSALAWKEWKEDMMIKIINEYRLNLANPEHYNTLITQMRAFLNLDGEKGEVLEVENAERGRS